jgi:hypothetical protein
VNPQMFYGPCRVTSRSVSVAIGPAVSLCPYDPSRLVLWLGVSVANNVQVAPRRDVTVPRGHHPGAERRGPDPDGFWVTVGPLVGMEWFAAATALNHGRGGRSVPGRRSRAADRRTAPGEL